MNATISIVSQHLMESECSILNSQEFSTCSYPEPDQFSPHRPHPTSKRSILILSTHERLGLPSGLLPFGLPTKNLHAFLFALIRATFTANLILLDLIILIIVGDDCKSRSPSLCSFLHPPVTSFQIFSFSNTHSLRSSLNIRNQVSNPYRTTGESIVLYILTFTVFDSRRENRGFQTE
jgi:hypothetical protein